MRIRGLLAGAALGAAIAYLWDPDRGHARRVQLRDRTLARLRDASGRAERAGRKLASDAEGKLRAVIAAGRRDTVPVDDATIADRVRSSVLGGADIPAGEVLVDVADGVVTLRGELPVRSQIQRIVANARRVEGVRAVDDLLHLPGESPANKAAARRASEAAAGTDGPTGSAIE